MNNIASFFRQIGRKKGAATPRPQQPRSAQATAECEEFDHPLLGAVTLACSPRAHRIAISVRATGAVRVSYPRDASRQRALEFLQSRIEWVTAARARLHCRQAALPPALSPEEAKRETERLRRAARIDLPPRIERLAAATGLRYGRLTIRAARTKWGSCSGANNISLSLFTMTLPEHLRDFVILHELCHTRHHDHSPRFHALLDSLCGGRERELARELRRYAIRG